MTKTLSMGNTSTKLRLNIMLPTLQPTSSRAALINFNMTHFNSNFSFFLYFILGTLVSNKPKFSRKTSTDLKIIILILKNKLFFIKVEFYILFQNKNA